MQTNATVTKVIERMLGFEKYQAIMNSIHSVDISSNAGFQKLFNDYYEVRRNEDWRKGYYQYFQSVKTNRNITFDTIIEHLFYNLKTNRGRQHPVEASFSSKMLATINPRMPILDSQVLNNMNLSISGETPEDKLTSAKSVYRDICDRYMEYIGSRDCIKAISIFDDYFPDYTDMTMERKIDWFLWGFSKTELIKIGLFGALL